MAVPVAAILAGGSAISSLLGGIVGSAQAKERAKFTQDLYKEQIEINDLLYGQRIRAETGKGIANVAARGIAQGGSATQAVFADAFQLQLRRFAEQAQLQAQVLQAGVQGAQQSQQALLGGIKSALGASMIGGKSIATANRDTSPISGDGGVV